MTDSEGVDEPETSRYERILGEASKPLGYVGAGFYVYFGIVKGQDVSEIFLLIVALLIHGEKVIDYLGKKK